MSIEFRKLNELFVKFVQFDARESLWGSLYCKT